MGKPFKIRDGEWSDDTMSDNEGIGELEAWLRTLPNHGHCHSIIDA